MKQQQNQALNPSKGSPENLYTAVEIETFNLNLNNMKKGKNQVFGDYEVKWSEANQTWQIWKGSQLIDDYSTKEMAIQKAEKLSLLSQEKSDKTFISPDGKLAKVKLVPVEKENPTDKEAIEYWKSLTEEQKKAILALEGYSDKYTELEFNELTPAIQQMVLMELYPKQQGEKTAIYENTALNETCRLGGVRDLAHAWNLVEFIAKRYGWNVIDVRVKEVK